MPFKSHPNLLVGTETSDDAAVYRLTDDIALIQTVDFFTPIVDDPYWFGQIAAANALSDVYAMGGKPLTAMNIVAFPTKSMDISILKDILHGGMDKIHEAGAVMAGGHSIEDDELKYGLSVTGIVHPDKVLTNTGAKPGDGLVLTKPVGVGIVATALKGDFAGPEASAKITKLMAALNRDAVDAMEGMEIHACTDITGFGLIGHLQEMTSGSNVNAVIKVAQVPKLAEAVEYAAMGLVPAGSYTNKDFCRHTVRINSSAPDYVLDTLFDPQTSGGLLIALPQKNVDVLLRRLHKNGVIDSTLIGHITEPGPGLVTIED